MRFRTSCDFCRSRKKRCVLVENGTACRQCWAKHRQCNLFDPDEGLREYDNTRDLHSSPQTAIRTSITSCSPQDQLSSPNLETPYSNACDELVDLYFEMIHYKQHLLFHPPTFMQQYRVRETEDFLVLGMMALSARFSEQLHWRHIPPTDRGPPLLAKAIECFYRRAELLDVASLQGAMLLGFAAFVEGQTTQESLLGAQAIRVVQLLNLKDGLGKDAVQREVNNALLWQAWTMDAWHAGRGRYPRQLELSSDQPRVMEELAFIGMTDLPSDRLPPLVNRNGLWTAMLPLHQMLNEVMQFNSTFHTRPSDSAETLSRVRQLDYSLQSWLNSLPPHMYNNPTNLSQYTDAGIGRVFLVMHLVYHHVAQLLFFHTLRTKPSFNTLMTIDECERTTYVSKCKAHATAISKLMYSASRTPGLECRWSPGNGHLLVVASCVHMHSLLFDPNAAGVAQARRLLEHNFTLLMDLRKFWPGIERSQARLRSFHRACQLSRRLASVFDMDEWMINFLIKDDIAISDRDERSQHAGIEDHNVSATIERDIDELWQELNHDYTITM